MRYFLTETNKSKINTKASSRGFRHISKVSELTVMTYYLESVLFSEAGCYKYQASGYNFQGSTKRSIFSQTLIRGAPFTFEDGKSLVS